MTRRRLQVTIAEVKCFLFFLKQICTHCTRGLGPLLHADLLQIYQASGSSIPPQVFSIGLRSGVWPGRSRTFEMLVKLCSYSSCLGSHELSQLLFLEGRRLLPKICNTSSSILSPINAVPFAIRHSKAWCFHSHSHFLHCTFLLCTIIIGICFVCFPGFSSLILQYTRFVLHRLTDFCFGIFWIS